MEYKEFCIQFIIVQIFHTGSLKQSFLYKHDLEVFLDVILW